MRADELPKRINKLGDQIRAATTTDALAQQHAGLHALAISLGVDKKVVSAAMMLAVAIAMELAGIIAWTIAAGSKHQSPVKSKLSDARSNTPSDTSPKRARKPAAESAKRSSGRASVSRPTDGFTHGVKPSAADDPNASPSVPSATLVGGVSRGRNDAVSKGN